MNRPVRHLAEICLVAFTLLCAACGGGGAKTQAQDQAPTTTSPVFCATYDNFDSDFSRAKADGDAAHAAADNDPSGSIKAQQQALADMRAAMQSLAGGSVPSELQSAVDAVAKYAKNTYPTADETVAESRAADQISAWVNAHC